MIGRREFWRRFEYIPLMALFPVISSAQDRTAPCGASPELAKAIGRAIIDAAQHYKRDTGKEASTVVVQFSGKVPTDSPEDLPFPPEPASGSYTQLNQSHFMFTVKVEPASEKAK